MKSFYNVISTRQGNTMSITPAERRRQSRVSLANPLVGRIGSFGAVLLDVSEGGARLEHYTRMRTGSVVPVRFEWESSAITTDCTILSCRVVRMAGGDAGATVYQSRVAFVAPESVSAVALKKMITAHVTRALAEQVANAKGLVPLDESKMPIFRQSALTSNDRIEIVRKKHAHVIPKAEVVRQRGYIRCSLLKGQMWTRKWVSDPSQPEDGFTVSSDENPREIDLLCRTYRNSDAPMREFIRSCAKLSLEREIQD